MQESNTSRLLEFIEASKAKGASDAFLADLLIRRGWPDKDVYSALAQHWEQATGLAVPARLPGGESSRDAFLYLLSFATLAIWASALGSMLFQFINTWFPDPVSGAQAYNLRRSVTWQMASIVVAFPIFLLVTRTILREAQQHPERLESGVRKWLTYIALLLTAGGLISDLIWFLDYFLAGELTLRFVLKAASVLMICGAIFVYYLGSLRWDRDTDILQARKRSLKFGFGAAAVLVASFCIGLGVAGTPSQQRRIAADERRVGDLRQIAFAVNDWYKRAELQKSSKLLPDHLSELVGHGASWDRIADPTTKRPYEYTIKSGNSYELCATFEEAEPLNEMNRTQSWHHGYGRTCFPLNAAQQPSW